MARKEKAQSPREDILNSTDARGNNTVCVGDIIISSTRPLQDVIVQTRLLLKDRVVSKYLKNDFQKKKLLGLC